MIEKPCPNVFASLFGFRPKVGLTPKENFLTEAFVYVLQTDGAASSAWLNRVLGRNGRSRQVRIDTRPSAKDVDTGSTIYPDVQYDGTTIREGPFRIRAEHKWDSKCDLRQLAAYERLFAKEAGERLLVFVCASLEQRVYAQTFRCRLLAQESFKVFLWEDVFVTLDQVSKKSRILSEFLQFMRQQELSPGKPIVTRTMKAFQESNGFREQLARYSRKLLNEHTWTSLPARYRHDPKVKDRYGRVAIEFATPDWAPAITLGFLHDTSDHGVLFTNPTRGIDILIRIEAAPQNNPRPTDTLMALKRKVKSLRKLNGTVHLRGQPGNENPHTLLIVRRCLGEVIQDGQSEQEQIDAIYKQFECWCEALFKDGKLEPALRKLK